MTTPPTKRRRRIEMFPMELFLAKMPRGRDHQEWLHWYRRSKDRWDRWEAWSRASIALEPELQRIGASVLVCTSAGNHVYELVEEVYEPIRERRDRSLLALARSADGPP